MPAIQVRDVPLHIYRALEEQAMREHRSLSQQVVATLARGLDLELDPKERRRRLTDIIRARGPIPGRYPDPATLVRQDRNR